MKRQQNLACTSDAEILMDKRIGDQLAQGNFRINADFSTQGLLDDFRARQYALEVVYQALEADGVAALPHVFVNGRNCPCLIAAL